MNEVDKAAFVKWYTETPLDGDEGHTCKTPPHEVWRAALEHRDRQASAVNEQMLEALEKLLCVVQHCHCENSGEAQDAARAAIRAAKAARGG
jgi:hypothetical protein